MDDHGCSFSGPNADQQAHDLALELRKCYKLEAYVHKAEFKLDDLNGGAAANPLSPARHRHYKKSGQKPAEIDEVAVLVGNYATVDDPDGQKTLKKLRYAQPECLKPVDGKPVSQTLAALHRFRKRFAKIWSATTKKSDRGPMGHAFVTTNPLLPPEYFTRNKGIDELVLKMNEGVTHSLLDCPGKYTVQVAHFMGTVIIDQREIQAIENGKQVKSSLTNAAEKAHLLTEALRIKGYEAYEFHDRYSSIVCVGSFNSMGTPRPDGKTEINPQIHAIMKRFGTTPQPALHNQLTPQEMIHICFDIQPIPVEVPKKSISRELARELQ